MQLSKDQIQKIFICAMFVIGIYYVCFSMLIGPAKKTMAKMAKDSEKISKDISTAEGKIKAVSLAEATQKQSEQYIAKIEEFMPNELPRTYYPPEILKAFSDAGVTISQPLVSSVPVSFSKVGNAFTRYGWIFSINGITYHDFGRLQAKIENERPLWQFYEIEMTANANSEEKHNVKMVMGTLNK